MEKVPAQVLKAFRKARSIVAVTHVNPDGDGIGAGLGLTRYARSIGKKAAMVISGQVPVQYRWLAKKGELRTYRGAKEAALIENAGKIKWKLTVNANWIRASSTASASANMAPPCRSHPGCAHGSRQRAARPPSVPPTRNAGRDG